MLAFQPMQGNLVNNVILRLNLYNLICILAFIWEKKI